MISKASWLHGSLKVAGIIEYGETRMYVEEYHSRCCKDPGGEPFQIPSSGAVERRVAQKAPDTCSS